MRSREETEGGKEKRKKDKLYILVKKTEGRRKWNRGRSSPFYCYLNCDLVAGEQNPVSVGNSGGRHAAGPVHA